ncbi:MAG: HIT family protein [Steroidobacteraceae bacterium]
MTLRVPSAGPCPFCAYLEGAGECAFVARDERVATFVNLRQYERGALLVVPVRHVATLLELDPDTLAAVHGEARRVGRALLAAFGASGLNVFQNNGIDAGQTIPHFHVHVVPRYPGGDPMRLFREANHTPVSYAERLQIAAAVQAHLEP